jgi:hypothetical protein
MTIYEGFMPEKITASEEKKMMAGELGIALILQHRKITPIFGKGNSGRDLDIKISPELAEKKKHFQALIEDHLENIGADMSKVAITEKNGEINIRLNDEAAVKKIIGCLDNFQKNELTHTSRGKQWVR